MFSQKQQRFQIMELMQQQNHTETSIIHNTKLLDGLLHQLDDLYTDFKALEDSVRTYQNAQRDFPNYTISPKKNGKDRNQQLTSEIKILKELKCMKGETKAEDKQESMPFVNNDIFELLNKTIDLNEKMYETMQPEKPIDHKHCSHSQRICTFNTQLGKFNELLEEVKCFERRQKDLLEEKHVEVKQMMVDMTSAWSKKSKQLEENVVKLAKSINTLKKTQKQNVVEGMKKVKNANLSSLTETSNQIQTKFDVEVERLRSRLFEEEINQRNANEDREKEKEKEVNARKMKEWEERRGVWQNYAKDVKNQLVTLEERLRHLRDENAQKVKTHDFEEIRKLQELLSERDAAIGGIREALEFLISKVHDPFMAGIGL